jgi:hypothetical protein
MERESRGVGGGGEESGALGGHPERRGSLRQHDLVSLRRDIRQDLAVPRALGHAEPAQLVVDSAVAAISGERLDAGVHDLDSLGPRGLDELGDVRGRSFLQVVPVVVVLRPGQGLALGALAVAVEVLHVDDDDARLLGHQRRLAQHRDGLVEEWLLHTPDHNVVAMQPRTSER